MKLVELFSLIGSLAVTLAIAMAALFWIGIYYLIKHLTTKNVNNYYYQYPPNQYPPNQYPPNQYPLAIPIKKRNEEKNIQNKKIK